VNIASTLSAPRLNTADSGSLAAANRLSQAGPAADAEDPKLRDAFDSFVGETFYAQMLSAMRKTTGKPAYMHGGQAEETFRSQLDQLLAQEMSKSNGGDLSDAMYEQFRLSQLSRS
jgi:Rod binding domain-containing protein